MPPPWAEMVSGPSIRLAWTLPPPESRLAPAASATVIGPPSLFAVTVTLDGTVTMNPTLQSDVAHAGAASVSRPWETWSVTSGAGPLPWS